MTLTAHSAYRTTSKHLTIEEEVIVVNSLLESLDISGRTNGKDICLLCNSGQDLADRKPTRQGLTTKSVLSRETRTSTWHGPRHSCQFSKSPSRLLFLRQGAVSNHRPLSSLVFQVQTVFSSILLCIYFRFRKWLHCSICLVYQLVFPFISWSFRSTPWTTFARPFI